MMKKLFFIAFMGLNIAVAEESGGFVGLEVGYGEAEIVNILYQREPYHKNDILGLNFNGGGVAYGFTIGYKQFFTPYFGLRYYANLNLLHANLNPKSTLSADIAGGIIAEAKKSSVMLLNYGANIDFMANVLASENADLGGFVGVGLGGDSWMGKGIEHQLELYKIIYPNDAQDLQLKSKTDFNVWINVGLRTNFAKYHGIELVARAPLLKNKLLDGNFVDGYNRQVKAKVTIKGIYSVSLRYTVSF